jgi:hypothetical protein
MARELLERHGRPAVRWRVSRPHGRWFRRARISKNGFAQRRLLRQSPAPPRLVPAHRRVRRRRRYLDSRFIAAPFVPDSVSHLPDLRVAACPRGLACHRSVLVDRAPCIRFRAPA